MHVRIRYHLKDNLCNSLFVTRSLFFLSISTSNVSAANCRCFPGDACWPVPQIWSDFNSTVDGKLIATVPLASPCHNPHYDQKQCSTLQSEWLFPEIHYESSSSIMAPFFTNNSCSPFTSVTSPCLLGNYIDYAVAVTSPKHVAQTIKFATVHNIRLVIRNTGHDYLGKSTGAGAIGIWTHHLKDIQITKYQSRHYTGRAIKMGAGVQGFEAYRAAHAKGYVVVGGDCPTVGLAGGYTQGGGHSVLSSKFGLAADQVLEWEVITGNGTFVIANRQQNSDLYWALSGGGGGTYGVVWSLTAKAHNDFITAGANLTFTNTEISQDTYYEAIGAYNALLPSIVEAGAVSIWHFNRTSFTIAPLTGPNMTAEALTALLNPFMDKLSNLGIKHTTFIQDYPSFLDQYNGMQTPIKIGVAQYGGWLIPRSVIKQNNNELTAVYRNITEAGAQVIAFGLDVGKSVTRGDVDNAVLPAWREALIETVIATPWNSTAPAAEMLANQAAMTNEYIPQLKALAPESGCYLNDGDYRQPDWKSAFYGRNYHTLRQIKATYDPNDVFYATTAVGADEWTVMLGRLCGRSLR